MTGSTPTVVISSKCRDKSKDIRHHYMTLVEGLDMHAHVHKKETRWFSPPLLDMWGETKHSHVAVNHTITAFNFKKKNMTWNKKVCIQVSRNHVNVYWIVFNGTINCKPIEVRDIFRNHNNDILFELFISSTLLRERFSTLPRVLFSASIYEALGESQYSIQQNTFVK